MLEHSYVDLCRDRPLIVIIPSGCAASVVTTYRTSPPECGFVLPPFSARVMPDDSDVAMLDNCQHHRTLRRQPLCCPACGHGLIAVESSSSRNLCQQSARDMLHVFVGSGSAAGNSWRARIRRGTSGRWPTAFGQAYVQDRLPATSATPTPPRRDAPCGASLRANPSVILPDSLSLRCCAPDEEQPNPLGAGQILCRAESAAAAS